MVRRALRFAAVQSASVCVLCSLYVLTLIPSFSAVKFGIAVYSFVFWGIHQAKRNATPIDIGFNALFVIMTVSLMLSQG